MPLSLRTWSRAARGLQGPVCEGSCSEISVHYSGPELPNVPVKGQEGNVLDFGDQEVSAIAARICCCSPRASIGDEGGSFPWNFVYQKGEAVGS